MVFYSRFFGGIFIAASKQSPDKQYAKMTKEASPNSIKLKNAINAFVVGGGICMFGQVLNELYSMANMSEDEVKAMVPITIIAITAILTGLGLFDNIAKFSGAGTFVPISGFANSIVAPAVEYQTEGRILGTGAKMFTIAGPVIVYGCGAAVLYGIIYYFLERV